MRTEESGIMFILHETRCVISIPERLECQQLIERQ